MSKTITHALSDPTARVLIWDIETRNLVGDYGSVFTIGWKWLGEKRIHVKTIHDIPGKHPLDDSALVIWFTENVWNQADVAVGWFSAGHDEAFLRTRLSIHGYTNFKPVTTLDMWKQVKWRFKWSKNTLDNVTRQLDCPPKYYGPRQDFEKILYGDKAAMKRIAKHNYFDIAATECVYNKLKGFFTAHPRLNYEKGKCHICGSTKLQFRGHQFGANKSRIHRIQCENGHWGTRLPREVRPTIGGD